MRSLLNKGKAHEALRVLSRRIDCSKNTALLCYWRGIVNFNLNNYESACNDLRRHVQLSPEFSLVMSFNKKLELSVDNLISTIDFYENWAKSTASNASFSKALFFRICGNYEASVLGREYEKELEKTPDDGYIELKLKILNKSIEIHKLKIKLCQENIDSNNKHSSSAPANFTDYNLASDLYEGANSCKIKVLDEINKGFEKIRELQKNKYLTPEDRNFLFTLNDEKITIALRRLRGLGHDLTAQSVEDEKFNQEADNGQKFILSENKKTVAELLLLEDKQGELIGEYFLDRKDRVETMITAQYYKEISNMIRDFIRLNLNYVRELVCSHYMSLGHIRIKQNSADSVKNTCHKIAKNIKFDFIPQLHASSSINEKVLSVFLSLSDEYEDMSKKFSKYIESLDIMHDNMEKMIMFLEQNMRFFEKENVYFSESINSNLSNHIRDTSLHDLQHKIRELFSVASLTATVIKISSTVGAEDFAASWIGGDVFRNKLKDSAKIEFDITRKIAVMCHGTNDPGK